MSLTTCLLVTTLATVIHSASISTDDTVLSWTEYKLKHGKQYDNNKEENYRRTVWQENVDYIKKHNKEVKSGLHSFTMHVNKYSDMTMEEFSENMLGYTQSPRRKLRRLNTQHDSVFNHLPKFNTTPAESIPHALDWRLHGYVTPVKDQGNKCGACWAFAATGALEGQRFKKDHKLIPLSEQNLVDCVHEHADGEPASFFIDEFGCQGADPVDAFHYIARNGGIDTENGYPYEGKDGHCRFKNKTVGARCNGFIELPPGDEEILKQAVALIGPIAAGIDADHRSFKHYHRGVYTNWWCSSEELNHAILIVGYGTTAKGVDYWLIKNSWGPTWGMNGYAMLPRNHGNYCGIASDCSFPTVN